MRIGASTLPALPAPVSYRRDDIGESPARQPSQAVVATSEPAAEREITRIRTRASTNSQQTTTDRQQFSSDSLPQRTRNALLSYTSNGPSIEERLGVELAGIDAYA
ncbi:MAG: hypothetical protein JWM78_1203 [Verrucomicrobiaceae bacterium]|nr:hypothetical protein [Verrucomicrobiaceae bacterium]